MENPPIWLKVLSFIAAGVGGLLALAWLAFLFSWFEFPF